MALRSPFLFDNARSISFHYDSLEVNNALQSHF